MKAPVVPIIIVVVVVGLAAYYFSGYTPVAPITTEIAKTTAGFEIAESALQFVDSGMRTPDGKYEYYIKYDSSGEITRSSEELGSLAFDADSQTFVESMVYIAYSDIARASGDKKYIDAASRKLDDIYQKCKTRKLCNGEAYAAVYRGWEETGNDEYRDALISARSALHDMPRSSDLDARVAKLLAVSYSLDKERSVLEDSIDYLRSSEAARSFDFSASELCHYTGAQLEIQKAGGEVGFSDSLKTFELPVGEPEGAATSTPLKPEDIVRESGYVSDLGELVACGSLLVDVYEFTGDESYKKDAETRLARVVNSHPTFMRYSSVELENFQDVADILGVASLAARLGDASVEVG